VECGGLVYPDAKGLRFFDVSHSPSEQNFEVPS
jgi:hypothetical protein